ncbi:unnamed protein product [Auanema sp. JU1783]|nr:unnamed protein product [Auanema sp. JU1783]
MSEDENEMEQYGVSDDSCLAFQAHDQDAFTVAICKDKYIASGGEDDRAFLWDWGLESETPLKIEHKDSVFSVGFNHSGALLATADLSGLVIITNTADGSIKYSLEETGDLEWALWHPKKNFYFAGAKDGTTWLFDLTDDEAAFPDFKTYPSHGAVTTVGCCTPDGSRLLVGYEDGMLKSFDIDNGTSLSKYIGTSVSYIAHHPTLTITFAGTLAGNVYTMNTNAKDGLTVFSTASADENPVRMKPKNDMDEEEEASITESVEAIAVSEKNNFYAVGRNDGSIKVYDVQHSSPRSVIRSPSGLAINNCLCVYRRDKTLLLAGSVDGTVKLMDPRDGAVEKEYGCGGDAVLDMKILRMEPLKFIASCSGGMLRVFDDSVATE